MNYQLFVEPLMLISKLFEGEMMKMEIYEGLIKWVFEYYYLYIRRKSAAFRKWYSYSWYG